MRTTVMGTGRPVARGIPAARLELRPLVETHPHPVLGGGGLRRGHRPPSHPHRRAYHRPVRRAADHGGRRPPRPAAAPWPSGSSWASPARSSPASPSARCSPPSRPRARRHRHAARCWLMSASMATTGSPWAARCRTNSVTAWSCRCRPCRRTRSSLVLCRSVSCPSRQSSLTILEWLSFSCKDEESNRTRHGEGTSQCR